MDNRVVLAVVFVTLSWMSLGTDAQSSTSMPMSTNEQGSTTSTMPTTMASAMTTNMTDGTTTPTMTTNMTNATMAPTMTTNMTNATTTPTMTTNMTNATTAPTMTTNMTNTTMAPTMGNNVTNGTMAPTTATTTSTTAAPTTAATTVPPLVTNLTVVVLVNNITNEGCGTEQLCAATPADCNPAIPGSCFFLGAAQLSGQNFAFSLSGESEGYLAASLSTDSSLGGNDTTYVCANDNGAVRFITALLNDGLLTETELRVNNVKGTVRDGRIQCTFDATVPSTVARAGTFSLGVLTGPFNATSGALGRAQTQLQSAPVNLADPTANATNVFSHAAAPQQSLMQALLITAGVLGFYML